MFTIINMKDNHPIGADVNKYELEMMKGGESVGYDVIVEYENYYWVNEEGLT